MRSSLELDGAVRVRRRGVRVARRRPRVVRSGREVRVEVRRAQTTALTALRVLHARHERTTFALREGALDPQVPLETLFLIL